METNLRQANAKATAVGSHTSTASCSSVSGGQANCSNYSLTNNTKDFTIKSATPADATSCSKYWYSFTYTCILNGSTITSGTSKGSSYYASASAANTACASAKLH